MSPPRHKTAHKGVRRIIQINHVGQEIIREVVDYLWGQECLFEGIVPGVPKIGNPTDTRQVFWRPDPGPTGRAEGWHNARSYGKAVERACRRAGVKLKPNQLRKLGLTVAAKRTDEETARQIASHTNVKMTRDNYIDPKVVEDHALAKARQYALNFGTGEGVFGVD